MFKYCNQNPKNNKVGDCVIRAISIATNQSWEDVYIELCLQGYLMNDMPSSNAVWNQYLHNNGYAREYIQDDCTGCYTVADFAEENATGTYIVGTGTHAVTVINGDIYDIWDSSYEQPIYYYNLQEESK